MGFMPHLPRKPIYLSKLPPMNERLRGFCGAWKSCGFERGTGNGGWGDLREPKSAENCQGDYQTTKVWLLFGKAKLCCGSIIRTSFIPCRCPCLGSETMRYICWRAKVCLEMGFGPRFGGGVRFVPLTQIKGVPAPKIELGSFIVFWPH